MTKVEIRKRLAEIERLGVDDPERAHVEEDELYEGFISDLARRRDSIGVRARLVLSTKDMDFPRWCA